MPKKDIDFIHIATKIAKYIIVQYIDIINLTTKNEQNISV
jgi:hypothetical protein